MEFEIRHPDFRRVIEADATLVEVAGGFGFTEGPIWHPAERWLLFSDIAGSCQFRWDDRNGLTTFRHPSNQANGNCFDPRGRVVSCEHASSALVRHEHGGKMVRPLATHHGGRALNSPNDVVCDRMGRLWFTDPSFGRTREDLGILREQELDVQGVYRLDPDGALHLVAADFEQPNGLCLSADETRLFVNDTPRGHVRVFDVDAGGALRGGAVWAEVTGTGQGRPDGMKLTTSGHLLCNGPGGVHVFAADARCLGVIRTPQMSTNFCFGGPDLGTLFVTATTSVYRIETRLTGLPMVPGARV